MAIATISVSFLVALAVLLIGVPVAVVMAGMGVAGGLATVGRPMIESMGSVIWSVQNENILTAIPLFVLLGEILLRSGIADRMYVSLSAWLGRLPGGLLHSNMASCALFAATCGSSVATAATIGTVAIPALKERGYDMRQALASLGVIVALAFALTVGRMNWTILQHCFRQTAAITGMIVLIICGSFILNVTLNFLSIPQALTKFVTSLGVGPTEIILILIVFYLILGCFLEVLSMQVTTIPIAYPIVTALGVDPIWFGVFIVLMSEIALITPPVGMNLYVVQSIRSDSGPISDVINGVWPYVVIMLGFTVFLWYVPEVVLWLPRNMF